MAIELSGLVKTYRYKEQENMAVAGLTLAVPPGQVLGLLGPNGAGKTTTIKMICGLILPTAGTVRLNGYDVIRQRPAAVRQVGAVLEGSRNVYWPLSAWQNLLYFGRLKGMPAREIKPRAEQLLTDLGLWERRNDTVGSYSRGMQQKVAIAAALIANPAVILLDEPTIGLDVEAARTVKDWVIRLARDGGKTVLLTTHQLTAAQELAGRIAVIREGSIIADMPTGELLSSYAEDRFTVRVGGTLPGIDGLPAGTRVETSADVTTVTLPDARQDTLHAVLGKLSARGVPLLSVTQGQPDLEEVFLHLLRADGERGTRGAQVAAGAEQAQ